MRDGPALVLACLGAGPRRPGRELGPFECQKNTIIVEDKLEETQNEVSFQQTSGFTVQQSCDHEDPLLKHNMKTAGSMQTCHHQVAPVQVSQDIPLTDPRWKAQCCNSHSTLSEHWKQNIQTCAIQVNETLLILQQRQESSTMPTPLIQWEKTLRSCCLLLWKSQRLSIPPLLRNALSKASAGLCRCLSHNSCRTASWLTTFFAQV